MKRIKLELSTPLETFSGCLMFIATGVLFIMGLGIAIVGPLGGGAASFLSIPERLLVVLICLATWYMYFKLYRSFNIYYILDCERNELLYHVELAGFQHDRLEMRLEGIVGVGVATHTHYRKRQPPTYGFSLVLGLQDGRVIQVSDELSDIGGADAKTGKLAEIIGCPHLPARRGANPRVNPQTRTLEYAESDLLEGLIGVGKSLLFLYIAWCILPLFIGLMILPPALPIYLLTRSKGPGHQNSAPVPPAREPLPAEKPPEAGSGIPQTGS